MHLEALVSGDGWSVYKSNKIPNKKIKKEEAKHELEWLTSLS